MSSGQGVAYVPAIDGLRAVAVLSVLFFHFGGWLPGGFVGVDVFFVISGYVVASAARDLPVGSIRQFVVEFYSRRLLRIAPALICCLFVTMVVMACVVPVSPDGRLTETNTKTGLAAFWGFSNFILSGSANDYWSPKAELNPFTHTWSLAIEEQFYLLFPLVYFAWLKGARRLARGGLAVAVIASLMVAAAWADSPVFSFYMLPVRFWELGVGVGIFFFRDRLVCILQATHRSVVETLAVVAMVALLLCLLLTNATKFPWPGALVPVSSVALLIITILARPSTFVARALAVKPCVYVGKISYSLYLWHWPVVVFGRWTSGMESVTELLLGLGLSWILAYLSFRFVESPVRYSKSIREYSRANVVAIALAVVSLGFAGAIGVALNRQNMSLSVASDPLKWRWDGSWPSETARCKLSKSRASFGAGQLTHFEPEGCSLSARTLYVAGDSHAGAYSAMLDLYARETGSKVHVYGKPGCGFFNLRRELKSEIAECQEFVRAALADIQANAKSGDLLFLPGLRVARYMDQWGAGKSRAQFSDDEAEDAAIASEAVSHLQPLTASGIRIIWEAPKPVLRAPPFRCSDWFNKDNPVCEAGLAVSRSEAEKHREVAMRRINFIARSAPMVSIWDPLPLMCPGNVCGSSDKYKPMLFDGDHISGFANSVLAPDFIQKLGALP